MNGLQNNHQSSTGTTYKLPSSPLNRILPGHGSSGQIKETNHLQGRGAALPWDILLQPHAILHLHRQSLRSTREESSCTEPHGHGSPRKVVPRAAVRQTALQAPHPSGVPTKPPGALGMQGAPGHSVALSSS